MLETKVGKTVRKDKTGDDSWEVTSPYYIIIIIIIIIVIIIIIIIIIIMKKETL